MGSTKARLIVFLVIFIIITIIYVVLSFPNLSTRPMITFFRSTQPCSRFQFVLPSEKNASVREFTVLSNLRNPKYGKFDVGSSNALRGRTIPTNVEITPNNTIVNVGFFEDYRRRWNYGTLFQPPQSPRTCECFNEKEVKFYANVTLEKNQSRTGIYEILFFPQDVSVLHFEPRVWDTILMVASQDQRRVYATFEGAAKLKFLALDPPYNNKIFHWSLTHHSKSDFTMPYGYYRPFPKQRPTSGPQINWAKCRSGLVAWMSTWTVTTWKREVFVQRLKKHVSVDVFGEIYGRKRCPRNSTQCEQKIRQYKFYLALENSCCSEYISEKFWRTLAWDVVPVVVGAPRESYERLAPPHSFIYADDFETVEDLAKYILKLHKNDHLYNEYFRWKEKGEVFVNYPDLQRARVTSNIPPKNFFYSCNSVCRVSNKYLNEKLDIILNSAKTCNKSSATPFFDPNVSWWCGSCTKCGQHDWIRSLN